MKKTLAIIIAEGKLDLFSNYRSKAALPFAGKYRLIDFSLSNCVNSGIKNIGVITQHMPNSLKKHIGIGKPWDLDRRNEGIVVLQPHMGTPGSGWYEGDAQATYKNIDYILDQNIDNILILPGHLVYKMDYRKLLKVHQNKNAQLTLAVNNIPPNDISSFKSLLEIGVAVFKKDVLINSLSNYCCQGKTTFIEDIIPTMIDNEKDVAFYNYDGYWKAIKNIDSYWESNLETAENVPKLNLYDNNWKVYTRSEEKPPAKFGNNSQINKSLISNGAIINGRVENSIISPGVYIEENAIITNSIILNNSIVRKNSQIDKTIIDKNVVIGANSKIGTSNDFRINKKSNQHLKHGLNIIAKDITIDENIIINRNCRIAADINNGDLENNELKSGQDVN